MLTVGGHLVFFIVDDDIEDFFLKDNPLRILLEDNIVISKKSVRAHRCQMPRHGDTPFLCLLLNRFRLPLFDDDNDQSHEKENDERGVKDEPGLKANGFRFFFRIHLDGEIKKLRINLTV